MGAAGSRYLWGPECPSPSPSSLRFLHRGSGAHGFADLHLPLPFSLQLSVRCGADRFKVYANGQHLFDFSHRLSAFQRVDLVEIHGDVTLSYVQI